MIRKNNTWKMRDPSQESLVERIINDNLIKDGDMWCNVSIRGKICDF